MLFVNIKIYDDYLNTCSFNFYVMVNLSEVYFTNSHLDYFVF